MKKKVARVSENPDLDHYDCLVQTRDRLFALACAIKGAEIARQTDRDGLLQATNDLLREFANLCAAFATEREIG